MLSECVPLSNIDSATSALDVFVFCKLFLYMLYTQHFIEQAGWQAFPEYSEEQENVLLTFMFDLVVDETQPFLVRAEVANKLPTTNLPGAPDLVEELKSYFIGKESLTSEESDLLTYLNQ